MWDKDFGPYHAYEVEIHVTRDQLLIAIQWAKKNISNRWNGDVWVVAEMMDEAWYKSSIIIGVEFSHKFWFEKEEDAVIFKMFAK